MINSQCIQCHQSQDTCTNTCNKAYNDSPYNESIGTRTWANSSCTNCQKDQNTCENICNMNWIQILDQNGVPVGGCIKCRADASSCSICGGQFDPVAFTCTNIQTYCSTSQSVCTECSLSLVPQNQFMYKGSTCYYCSQNQYICEYKCKSLWLSSLQYCELLTTVNYCLQSNRGVWDSANSECIYCDLNSANCTLCNPNNIYVAIPNSNPQVYQCVNVNLSEFYCKLKGSDYGWVTGQYDYIDTVNISTGKCQPCNVKQVMCQNYCGYYWDTATNTCLQCNQSSSACSGCLKTWIPASGSLPNQCLDCTVDEDTCVNQCSFLWISNTCLQCNKDIPTCENQCAGRLITQVINLVSTTQCYICKKNKDTCEQYCKYVWDDQLSICYLCIQSQTICEDKCKYVWDYVNNRCNICNDSKNICEDANKCAGFWLSTNICTQEKCNQDKITCELKCKMKWNPLQITKCLQCGPLEYPDNINIGQCLKCQDLKADTCFTNCGPNQFFWDTKVCRQCKVGEYWSTNQCLLCTTINSKCTQCSSATQCDKCVDSFIIDSNDKTKCVCINYQDVYRYLNPNTQNCSLCSALLNGCKVCSNETTCTQCQVGYITNVDGKTCRQIFTFIANIQYGTAFITDFLVKIVYQNTDLKDVTYSIYFYSSVNDFNLQNFNNGNFQNGILFKDNLQKDQEYVIKLPSGKPLLVPKVLLKGQVIPITLDQTLQFDVAKQFEQVELFSKFSYEYLNQLQPQDFYYKTYANELDSYYKSFCCQVCPTGINPQTPNCQCQPDQLLFDCSGFTEDNFNAFVMKLFDYYNTNNIPVEFKQKLLNHINTVNNDNMNLQKLKIFSELIKNSDKTKNTNKQYDDLIKRVINYQQSMLTQQNIQLSPELYNPIDNIKSVVPNVLTDKNIYSYQIQKDIQLVAGNALQENIIDKINVQNIIDKKEDQDDFKKIFKQSSPNTDVQVTRIFYSINPFTFGNSTIVKYRDYPFVELLIQKIPRRERNLLTDVQMDIQVTFPVQIIKQGMKCVQREGDVLQLCAKTEQDKINIAIVCTCKNSATLIEKLVLFEKQEEVVESNDNLLIIIIGSSVGGFVVIVFIIAFIYLHRRLKYDKFKILKKQDDGTRAIDPNISLSKYSFTQIKDMEKSEKK